MASGRVRIERGQRPRWRYDFTDIIYKIVGLLRICKYEYVTSFVQLELHIATKVGNRARCRLAATFNRIDVP